MLIVTWNVNSLRARLPRVLELLELHKPDVVCLQETKVADDTFPVAELQQAGYGAVHHSAGQWAGVALLARAPLTLTRPSCGLPGEPDASEARWCEATVDGIRFASTYVPNGRTLDSPEYPRKLGFLRAVAQVAANGAGEPRVIAGDMNIAPADIDVYDPAAFVGGARDGVDMKIVDGSLNIRSPRTASRYVGGRRTAALADDAGFVDTGDMVERRGDRCFFVGRKGGIINIGGLKVHPEEIEAVINRHDEVRMSRVRARKSPITGAIVVAEVWSSMPVFAILILAGLLAMPREPIEAAKVDGCTPWQAFWQVEFPLAGPGIASAAIFAFMTSWNEFALASQFTRSVNSKTLPVGLLDFTSEFTIDWRGMCALAVVMIAPALALTFVIQKRLVSGLTFGAVKG